MIQNQNLITRRENVKNHITYAKFAFKKRVKTSPNSGRKHIIVRIWSNDFLVVFCVQIYHNWEGPKKGLDFLLAQNMSNSGRKHTIVGNFQTHISFSPYLRDIKKSCGIRGLRSGKMFFRWVFLFSNRLYIRHEKWTTLYLRANDQKWQNALVIF